ncbi:MAG: signal recognition particle-docking protein FtsY [Nitrospirales bacterium]|nr:signal recognition particle-docking protein FtsY [Nitrospirales bacterium]
MSWFDKLRDGLGKTRQHVEASLRRLVGRELDPDTIEEVEAALLGADVGIRAVTRLMTQLQDNMRGANPAHSLDVLKVSLCQILTAVESDSLETLIRKSRKPFVILTVGINGVGKTTNMAKLGSRLKHNGLTPLLVAADTFRAAAIEQLEIWGKTIGADVIKHRHGADPAAVVFDGISAAKARGVDVVLIDTAGRLHTKVNLMDELKKMQRVLNRELPGAPHEVLLTLDGTLGQNAIAQAKQFHEALGVTGLVLTKLDGTAKGGVLVAIAEELNIPVRLLGVGEGEDDLQDFHAKEFVDALVEIPAS